MLRLAGRHDSVGSRLKSSTRAKCRPWDAREHHGEFPLIGGTGCGGERIKIVLKPDEVRARL
jgi:hypothetical protein